jgi:hypothetical protein
MSKHLVISSGVEKSLTISGNAGSFVVARRVEGIVRDVSTSVDMTKDQGRDKLAGDIFASLFSARL